MFERLLMRREVELIEDIARFMEVKHRDQKAHDYAHVLAVVNYAIRIATAIPDEADPFVLICGAFFHDIGWIGTITGVMHGLRGATVADEYLASTWVPADARRRIKGVIVRHSITSGLWPETVEEKIVWDADGLAGLGLLGMLRGIIGGAGSMEEIIEACLRFAGKHFDRLYFDESRRLGQELHAETEQVITRFEAALALRKEHIADLQLPVMRPRQ